MDPKNVKKVGVLGLGKMGADWVANCLEAGFEVIGFDVNPTMFEKSKKQTGEDLEWLKTKKYADDEFFNVEARMGKYTIVESEDVFIKELQSCQIFLECIFEDIELKCSMLQKFTPLLPEDIILWSNTSSLNVLAMADACVKPENFIGTHGMNPVYQMPAVEVVRHKKVAEEALQFTLDVLKNMGKKPFVASDVSGFWVNKHLMPFMYDAYRALERGEITVADGDWGFKGSLGHPQGIFKLSDFIGMDTMYRVGMAMYLSTQDPRLYPPLIVFRMIARNELGVKTGKGFYQWDGYKIVKERDFSDLTIKDSNEIINIGS
ncbi:3-hydroxyacyl-CoA dehydrogenase family protein [Desulfobacula phenolica]|uniref:3-hydroxybutyryl-CoA dehydrogenase n=1 Tax=Desulfobacula phenolica TaxID=90732 RepID=A0A1H2IUW7_9BACT|nr:3-hydroxyacyl-CoA dehydrogenase family protein [Desulfobacula phenolica]SDU47862.1 3-hydroxybutyryl-CoA dehydrogenase [Desulfobacula phenolica]